MQRTEHSPLSPSLPLTPATLLWKEKKLLNFASHDYLGLSQHPQMRKAAIKYLLHYGTGICHPEIKSGYVECQRHIEERWAEALGFSHAHIFASRLLALNALLDKEWTLFFDDVSAPLVQRIACQRAIPFAHRDLSTMLSRFPAKKRLIVCQSLSSATGQIEDVNALILLAKQSDAFLLIDDTHAFGVKGKSGFGLAQGHQEIDFVLCGLDCGAGASGAVLCFSERNAPYFTEAPQCREYAPAFSALGAIEAALELIEQCEGERMQLEQRTHWMRRQLHTCGLKTLNASSHIIALPCVSQRETREMYEALLDKGILVETANDHLLLILNIHHTPDELSSTVHALQEVYRAANGHLSHSDTACLALPMH